MRNSGTLDDLRFKAQRVEEADADTTVLTEFEGRDGLGVEHRLRYTRGQRAFSITTAVHNRGTSVFTLEHLASASLMGITPFARDDAAGRLRVHRFRTSWSNEGKLETRSVEALDLERSWTGHGVRAERFGQVGSMPVKSWHPLAAVGSFSDAHETREIPLIAANLHRLLPPRQSQIWAVLHPRDDMRRLRYSLAATFLGRMCLSGDIIGLSARQWALVLEAMRLYREAAPVIAAGISRRCGTHDGSAVAGHRHPRGWQGVLRVADSGRHALAVVHGFAPDLPDAATLVLPDSGWRVCGALVDASAAPQVVGPVLSVPIAGPWSGAVVLLAK